MQRRHCLSLLGAGAAALAVPAIIKRAADDPVRPNIILCMSDDQGWGDVGYNGHPVLRTPHLDRMAREGIRFDRFYAGSSVCSPTRGSCLTGRNANRFGIYHANVGHLRRGEVTIGEALQAHGYATGHFGKWHLGTLTRDLRDGRRGGIPGNEPAYSPPWEHGFETCFSTEASVPTYHPMRDPVTAEDFGTLYWTAAGRVADSNLRGDDSRIIMDRALLFMRAAVRREQPFLAVIWFHTPHSPVVAGPDDRASYEGISPSKQHYYGSITAMDEQLGRLRRKLAEWQVDADTLLWFCSDNGPAEEAPEGYVDRLQGSTGGLRGAKNTLLEGGIRVPAVLIWPRQRASPGIVSMPCSTDDFYPTILDHLQITIVDQPEPLDGISLMSTIDGTMLRRPNPMGFKSLDEIAWIDDRYKLYSDDGGKSHRLFDVETDRREMEDLAKETPGRLARMKQEVTAWLASVAESDAGADYS